MARLNVNLKDEYLDVVNMFKVSNKSEIERVFEKSDQQEAVQYIILKFMELNNLSIYVEYLKNKENTNNFIINKA